MIHNVVQFLVYRYPYLRFGQDYHKNIIKEFADEIGFQITVDNTGSPPLFFLPDESMISGMGRCELNTGSRGLTERVAEFYGSSTDYHKVRRISAINQEHLELINPLYPNIRVIYKPNRYI